MAGKSWIPITLVQHYLGCATSTAYRLMSTNRIPKVIRDGETLYYFPAIEHRCYRRPRGNPRMDTAHQQRAALARWHRGAYLAMVKAEKEKNQK